MKFFILRTYKRPLSLFFFCRRNIVHVSFGAMNKPSFWLISASDCIRSPWLTLASAFISPTGLCLVCFGVYAPYFVFFAGNGWVKSPNILPSSKPCFHRSHVRNVTIWASLCGSRVFRFKYLLSDGRPFTHRASTFAPFVSHHATKRIVSRWQNCPTRTMKYFDRLFCEYDCFMSKGGGTRRQFVDALRHQPEGRGFDSRWRCPNFSLI
jgi:hypothetical protein